MKKQKIICLQGLPASGKTTWARKFIEENDGWMRVNKDDIRRVVGMDAFDKQMEEKVIQAERNMVKSILDAGFSVIVDNTHLYHKKTKQNKHLNFYEDLANSLGIEFEIKTFIISLEEAIERDKYRDEKGRVGEKVFDKFEKIFIIPNILGDNPNFKEDKMGLNYCIICDLDGTLAFMDNKRSPYDYEKVVNDRLNIPLSNLLRLLKNITEIPIIFLSGREDNSRNETQEWLNKHDFGEHQLLMRKTGDRRGDEIVKKELYEEHIKDKYNVLAVFDDRNKVVDMWRMEGLPTYQVWYGDF